MHGLCTFCCTSDSCTDPVQEFCQWECATGPTIIFLSLRLLIYFSTFTFSQFIQVEHKVIPEGKDALKSLLESKGYRVRVETEIDFIFEYIAEQGGTKD